jgi:hypothetical protein
MTSELSLLRRSAKPHSAHEITREFEGEQTCCIAGDEILAVCLLAPRQGSYK